MNVQRNKNLGIIREKRVKEFISKVYKWNIIKTNIIVDKYHAIDFIATNNKNKLIYIQVKSIARLNEAFETKAISYAKFHKADLYYFYVDNKYHSKIYVRKVNYAIE